MHAFRLCWNSSRAALAKSPLHTTTLQVLLRRSEVPTSPLQRMHGCIRELVPSPEGLSQGGGAWDRARIQKFFFQKGNILHPKGKIPSEIKGSRWHGVYCTTLQTHARGGRRSQAMTTLQGRRRADPHREHGLWEENAELSHTAEKLQSR